MSQLVATYTALTSLSTRAQVSGALANIVNASPFTFNESQRETLVQTIINDVDRLTKAESGSDTGRLSSEDAAQALLAVKALGKTPTGSRVIATRENLVALLAISNSKTLQSDVDAMNEALRCVANCMLLIDEARITFVSKDVGGGAAMVTLLERSSSAERIFLASRILFLASVSITFASDFIKQLVENKYPEQSLSMIDIIGTRLDSLTHSILAGEKFAREAMTDLLKFSFNLLLHYPKIVDESNSENDTKEGGSGRKVMGDCWSDRLEGVLPPLLKLLNNLPPTFPAPLSAPLTHVIHALITIPVTPSLRTAWFPSLSKPASPISPSSKGASSSSSTSTSPRATGSELRPGSRSASPGSAKEKMGALDRALSKFSVSRRSPSPTVPQDTLLRGHDLLDVTLSHYMPGDIDPDDPSVRDLCKSETDGTLDDTISPLVLLVTKLCHSDETSRKRMRGWILPDDLDRTSPLEGRSDLLGRCLRLLSCVHHTRLKESMGEMLYAICDSDASTLASYVGYGNVAGFLFNKGIMSAPPRSSTSGAPAVTTSGAQIDPITGVVREEKPLIEMTDEEKEREAEKLFVLFDRLERSGALPPSQNPIRRAAAEGRLG